MTIFIYIFLYNLKKVMNLCMLFIISG